MNSTVCVLVVAGLMAFMMPGLARRVLPDAGGVPLVALLAWQVASLSVVASWVLVGVLLPNRVLGFAVAGGVLARLAYCVAAVARDERRRRRTHAEAVRIVGRRDPALGATIVDSDVPAVYCVAGRPHTIVVTSGARDVLPAEQLRAALAHERAHLAGRHHLVLVLARAVARAFPAVVFFDLAARETARLVEVLADDAAARRHGRRTVAEALLRLACGRIPAAALGAGGAGVLPRVQRLLVPAPVTAGQRLRWAGALAVVAGAPLIGVAAPVALLLPYLQACSLPGM